jgi:hypothetical protein
MGYIGSGPTRFNTADELTVTGDAEVTGAITTDGMTTTGNVLFGDNDKAIFGAGSDLQIWHSSTESYVGEVGTGNLVIFGDANVDIQNAAGLKTFRGESGGGAYLFHANNVKLATTATGVDVTGNIDNAGGDMAINVTQGNLTLDASVNIIYDADGGFHVFRDGGTERMRIDSSGNVGIGTTSPSERVEILHSSDAGLKWSKSGSSYSGYLYQDANGSGVFNAAGVAGEGFYLDRNSQYMYMTTGGSERLRIDSSGRVGIGTASPARQFHLHDASGDNNLHITNSTTGATSTDGFSIVSQSSTNDVLLNQRESANMRIFTANTERLRVDSGGNVGIGTTSPGAILDVGKANNAGDVDFRFFNRGAGSTNSSVTIGMYPTNSSIRGGEIICFADNPGSGQFSMRFLTSNTTAVPSERMRIDRSGNVLIGKTAADVTTNGFSVEPAGTTFMTRGDNRPLILNRQSSTGSICDFRQASTTVGTVSVTGSGTTYNTTSDIRLKTDIEPIDHATDMLMAMNPVSHRWKADPDADAVVGFIAQEMQEIVPEAVNGDADSDEMMSMDYGRITPVLVAALQDAHNKIEQLEQRLADMENK